ncbi:MAG: tyrosine-type recombinase/integrase [Solirubrobacteraceae bacterium]
MRVSEAIALQPEDLDLQSAMLRADANGPKERLVPVSSSALGAVRDYLQHGRPLLLRPRKQPRLFVNQHGNGLTREGIYQIVQGHARTAGLPSGSHHAQSATPARRTCWPAASSYRPEAHRHRHHPAVHQSARRRLTGRRPGPFAVSSQRQ